MAPWPSGREHLELLPEPARQDVRGQCMAQDSHAVLQSERTLPAALGPVRRHAFSEMKDKKEHAVNLGGG